jgi:hypothetical protein
MNKIDAVFARGLGLRNRGHEMSLSVLPGDLPSVWFCGIVRFATRKVAQVTSVRWSVVAVNLLLPQSQPCFNRLGLTSKPLT